MQVKPGAVITDVARPLDLSAEDVAKRPDVLVTDMSMGALDRTHQVIDVIEGRGEAAHSAVTPHDSTVDTAPGIACDITDADCPLETQTYPPAPASTVTNNY